VDLGLAAVSWMWTAQRRSEGGNVMKVQTRFKARYLAAALSQRRMRLVLGASMIVASMALASVAVATGPTGSIASEVIGAGSMPNGIGFVATPGTNTVVADFTFGPNSSTGWHTHPGKTLVTVKSGTFTVYHARDCEPTVYGPGDAFVELPSTVHVGRNETGDVVELGVVFFGVPIGGSPRIDQSRPEGCEIT
jgi:quercetin dioxygenase-like cupin family protein